MTFRDPLIALIPNILLSVLLKFEVPGVIQSPFGRGVGDLAKWIYRLPRPGTQHQNQLIQNPGAPGWIRAGRERPARVQEECHGISLPFKAPGRKGASQQRPGRWQSAERAGTAHLIPNPQMEGKLQAISGLGREDNFAHCLIILHQIPRGLGYIDHDADGVPGLESAQRSAPRP